jgi:hypothetical protein
MAAALLSGTVTRGIESAYIITAHPEVKDIEEQQQPGPDEGSIVKPGCLYHVAEKHRLFTSFQVDIPEDVQTTVIDLMKVGMEKTGIFDYVYLRTGHLLSPFPLAAIDS